jgi:Holliday junction resolvasome RuvABC endonuclease subunit
MVAIGIDPSTTRVAIASLDESGEVDHRILPIPDSRGARRFRHTRDIAESALRLYDDVAVIAVEIPWSSNGTAFSLMGGAAVLCEVAQHVHPGAVVIELPTQVWKKDSVGAGNASKAAYIAHAIGLGATTNDEDACAALCIAQAAWVRWQRAIDQERAA